MRRRDIRNLNKNIDRSIKKIHEYASHFENEPHTPKVINDGITQKKREIVVPKGKEQVVHHMAVQVLMPLLTKGMYEYTYASIPGRGSYAGSKDIKRWIKRDPDNTKYCLKMDIRKFFYTIPHDIMLDKLSCRIKDKDFLEFLGKLLTISESNEGLPLGFYTSQWFSNWYLQDLDHYIKEQLHVKYYARYMDDMVLFGSSKTELHKVRKLVSKYVSEELGLQIKDNWQVFPFDNIDENDKHHGRALDFMGFVFRRDRTILRKSIMLRASRKAKRISKKSRITVYDARQMLAYLGWIKNTDSYGFYSKHISPYVNIGQLKKIVSRYDKKHSKNKKGDQSVCGSTSNQQSDLKS